MENLPGCIDEPYKGVETMIKLKTAIRKRMQRMEYKRSTLFLDRHIDRQTNTQIY